MHSTQNSNLFNTKFSSTFDENFAKMNKDAKKKVISKKKKPVHMKDKLSRILFAFLKRGRPSVSKERDAELVLKAGQYLIQGLICEGTFGKIMFAKNVNTQVTTAAKLEAVDAANPQLQIEFIVYELLGNLKPGFIKIFYYGPCDRLYNALVMELLGPDLDDLFVSCRSSFSYKTILIIAMQTIKLIKHVHDKGIIYRDVKPENFCIGTKLKETEKLIHIIDFGLAKIISGKTKQSNTPQVDFDYLVGTARYMSINAHYGVEQSRRDDLESLGYMYMYFLVGRLPWMGLSRTDDAKNHYRSIAEIKAKFVPEELIRKYPEFVSYINYVRNLQFNENPDYEYLYNLMKDRFIERDYVYDGHYDWTSCMNKRYLSKALDVDPDE